ncbi:MAG: amidohydrolase [Burkholderiales bacterium]
MNALENEINERARALEGKLIAWRRDFHQHPELSNRESRTGKIVAEHLLSLGLTVQTTIARTGVVALLRGALPGPVVALRADMDALPVGEEVDLPFASKAKAEYEGKEVSVMHACGHDAHTAILMAVAEILVGLKDRLAGSVKFIFQPAEEGPPHGEEGGAELMIKEGVLENPRPAAIFGLHVIAGIPTGKIGYRPGPTMASGDTIRIKVQGRQTHGAFPWQGVDPVVLAAQIVLGLQTIPSRQIDVTMEPSVVTISCIHGGVRSNIIPDHVELLGTMRTFNEAMRADIRQRIKTTAEKIAESAGGSAHVKIEKDYDVTINDHGLTEQMAPTLSRVAGESNTFIAPKLTGSEDFSKYQQVIPGLFFFVGITPPDAKHAAPNHSPHFRIDESGLSLGVRALAQLAIDYLHHNS